MDFQNMGTVSFRFNENFISYFHRMKFVLWVSSNENLFDIDTIFCFELFLVWGRCLTLPHILYIVLRSGLFDGHSKMLVLTVSCRPTESFSLYWEMSACRSWSSASLYSFSFTFLQWILISLASIRKASSNHSTSGKFHCSTNTIWSKKFKAG